MKLSEFREHTKDYDGEVEIVIAGGSHVVAGIEAGSLYESNFKPYAAKAVSIADTHEAVVIEL